MESHDMTETIAVFIPIVAIIFGIGIGMVAIIAKHRVRMQRNELRHKERLAAMERGLELPPELQDDDGVRRPRHLLNGLILLAVGITVWFALDRVASSDIALFGLIPAGIGVATLAYYFIEGRKERTNGNGGDITSQGR